MPIDRDLVIIAKLLKIHSQNAKLFTKSAFCKEYKTIVFEFFILIWLAEKVS